MKDKDTDRHRLANIVRYLMGARSELSQSASGQIQVQEEDGVRYLQFGTPWIQGAMRLSQPDALEVEYVQQMMLWTLFDQEPQAICQLGLGVGALTRFCYHHFPQAVITAVEIDQEVITTCHEHFLLPPASERLALVHDDAADFVANADNQGRFDVLQVDLYDAESTGPARGSAAFYQDCAQVLTESGMMTINLFCEYPDHHMHLKRMEAAFEAVAWLPEVHDSNIVAIGFRQAPVLEFDDLYRRATKIEQTLALPASTWVDGLYKWMQHR